LEADSFAATARRSEPVICSIRRGAANECSTALAQQWLESTNSVARAAAQNLRRGTVRRTWCASERSGVFAVLGDRRRADRVQRPVCCRERRYKSTTTACENWCRRSSWTS